MAQPGFRAADKVVLMLSLVPYLIEVGEVSIADAARHFEVSEQQIDQAVRMIARSGVPGESRMYLHDDLFDINWDAFDEGMIVLTNRVAIDDTPRFSAKEASALIAGLQYLNRVVSDQESALIDGLLDKLARGSSARPGQVAVAGAAAAGDLTIIREAIADGMQLQFAYQNLQGVREARRVDPLTLFSRDEAWYLRAWCYGREAVRTFRLDRMSGISRSGLPAQPRVDVPAEVGLFTRDDGEGIAVELAVAEGILPALAEFLEVAAEAEETAAGWSRRTIRVGHFHGLNRLVAGNAGLIRVLGPQEAIDAVAAWAAAGLQDAAHETTAPDAAGPASRDSD